MKSQVIFYVTLVHFLLYNDHAVFCLRSRYRLIRTYSNPAPLSGAVGPGQQPSNVMDQEMSPKPASVLPSSNVNPPQTSQSSTFPPIATHHHRNPAEMPVNAGIHELPPSNAVPPSATFAENNPPIRQNVPSFSPSTADHQSQDRHPNPNFAANPFAAAFSPFEKLNPIWSHSNGQPVVNQWPQPANFVPQTLSRNFPRGSPQALSPFRSAQVVPGPFNGFFQ